MNKSVLSAIFRRNFSSYFTNPTGYVFICVFVLLSSFAAFWPNEFFTANLATLDQLNKYFPWIMLIFIPAITMSIWAEERRQGTDELLLTIPATDLDVVLGKYLAAVAIYAGSLVFSFLCNWTVLAFLGNPDGGLLAATYVGYFLVGLAMLAIGMVASFLTNNITVGFVLVLFNAPLVFAANADAIPILPESWVQKIKEYGVSERLRDFGEGVISLSSTAYFLAIVVVMLYLAMVLIGKRHWAGGRDGTSLAPHFLVRAVCLAAAAVGLLWLLSVVPVRQDISKDQLSTLAGGTLKIVKGLDDKRPVQIEAFISPVVPDAYVPVRLDLIRRLREIAAYGGKNVTLRIIDTEPFSEESDRAEKLYGIKPREIDLFTRGQARRDTVFMSVVLSSGLDKIVIPFIEPSTPIEYELVRSISTLNGTKRKRLGLFVADKSALQDFDRETGGMKEAQVLGELRQQYDVVDVDAAKPVPGDIDVLMAVQPSVMQPAQIENLIAAVRIGVPTVVFEDAFSIAFPSIREQGERGGQFPFLQETETKKLWDMLGIDVVTQQIANHGYNPIQDSPDIPPEYVFVGNGALGTQNSESLFDESDPISQKTQELVFMFPGWITKKENAKLKFTPLVRTSNKSGYVDKFDLMTRDPFGMGGGGGLNPRRRRHPTGAEYVLVARIQGAAPAAPPAVHPLADQEPSADGAKQEPKAAAEAPKNEVTPAATPSATASATKPAASATPSATTSATAAPSATPSATAEKPKEPRKPRDMDVVVFSDLDFLSNVFFQFRSQRQSSEAQRLNFDNVALILNAVDVLAGDDRFVDIRKRRPTYRTLERLDEVNQEAQNAVTQSENEYKKKFDSEIEKEERQLNDKLEELRKNTTLKQIDKESRLEIFEKDIQRRLAAKRQQLETQLEKQVKDLKREQTETIRSRQYFYKMCAVVLPPIPPLLIGLIVFFNRRSREQEGVEKSRLR